MGAINDKKRLILDRMMDKGNLTTLEKQKFMVWGEKFENIIWIIVKFIFLTYLFNKVYARIGFDKTIIIMMVTIIISLRSNLRQIAQKEEKKSE